MQKLTPNEYDQYVKRISPDSPLGKNILWAFLIGGLICTIGEGFRNLYMYLGCSDKAVASFTSITMVAIGAILTGFNLYDNIAKYAGAGTIIPITGFANSIVSIAMEYKSEGYILGVAAKMFVIAGPVLVFGTISSVVCGIIYWVISVI